MSGYRLRLTTIVAGISLLALFGAAAELETVEVPTYLRPYRSIEMLPAERGIIREVLVDVGEEVEKGQVLVRLDAEVIEAQLEEARARAEQSGQIEAAEAERDLAKQRLGLITDLESRGTSGQAELERGRANLKAAEGILKTAEEAIKLANLQVETIEAQLERRLLRSPIKSTVVDVTNDVAEVFGIEAGEKEPYLVRLVELDRLQARAHVPFSLMEGIEVGQTLPLKLEDAKGTTATGVIENISPIVNPASETVEIRLIFKNADRRLTSGVPAKILVPGIRRE